MQAMRALAWLLGLSLIVDGAAAQQPHDLSSMPGSEIRALQQRLTADGCFGDALDGQASPALQAAITACPSQEPILRIETGSHLAPIHSLAAFQSGRDETTTFRLRRCPRTGTRSTPMWCSRWKNSPATSRRRSWNGRPKNRISPSLQCRNDPARMTVQHGTNPLARERAARGTEQAAMAALTK